MTYRLLIVDDSKLARMSAAKALKALYPDWERLEAANSDEALMLAKGGEYDIGLLDFNMPGRDGLELARELRAMHPNKPLAILSANHQDEIVSQARALGAEFLTKPLTEQALGRFLQDALHQVQSAK